MTQTHQSYNTQFFKRWSPIYDLVATPINSLRKKVAQRIRTSHAKILDMACGTGTQAIILAKQGHSVVGVDLSQDMLKKANKKIKPQYNVEFIYSDASQTNFEDNTFDVSLVSFALHDMPEQMALAVLREMIRTTKPNGQIFIIDYNTPQSWLGHQIIKTLESKYYKHFIKTGLKYYLDQVGLSPTSQEVCFFKNFQIIECVNIKNT